MTTDSNLLKVSAASSVGGQFALIDAPVGNPFWSDRAIQADVQSHLGEALIINSHVTSTPAGIASLVHPEQRASSADWIRSTLGCSSEEAYPGDPNDPEGRLAVLTPEIINSLLGLDIQKLPDAYQDWRYSVEIYFIVGDTVYILRDRSAVRFRVLSEEEMIQKESQALLPFVDSTDSGHRDLVILTVVPNRMASMGGLRGFRTALVHGGNGMAALVACSSSPEWNWTTEFFDNVAGRLIAADGLERVVIGIGYLDMPVDHYPQTEFK